MTKAVWTWSIVTALVLLGGWVTAEAGAHAPALRSEHSEPAVTAPAVVTVTSDGKLFHRAGCTFIHGPARTESGAEAMAEGYTPCTRCLPR